MTETHETFVIQLKRLYGFAEAEGLEAAASWLADRIAFFESMDYESSFND